MNFPRFQFLLGAVLLFGAFPSQSADRPNIVLVTADDLGMHLGCYGYEGVATPNLDAFAEAGMVFDRAYVTQASCSPSRSSMLTGLYPHENGQVGLAPFSKYGYRMKAGVATLPRTLKDAGYRTAILGKIHLEPQTAALFPTETPTLAATATQDVERVANDAEAFIADGSGPFFLMVNYFDPHRLESAESSFVDELKGYPRAVMGPDEVEPFDFQAGLDFPDLRKQIAGYLNSTRRLDEGFGLLMERLEKLGVRDETLIVFISDHGAPFTLAKCSVSEAGVRVPLMVTWPGRIPAGQRTEFLTSSIDLMPTLLAAAGVAAPEGLPGLDLLPLLETGKVGELEREYLFTEFTAHAAGHYYPKRAVRDDRYKLIWNLQFERRNPLVALNDRATKVALKEPADSEVYRVFDRWLNPPEFEFYDLAEDPHEFVNLAGTPEVAAEEARLLAALDEWRTETDDEFDAETPNPGKTK